MAWLNNRDLTLRLTGSTLFILIHFIRFVEDVGVDVDVRPEVGRPSVQAEGVVAFDSAVRWR